MARTKQPEQQAGEVVILGPEVEPHTDRSRVIGLRTRYTGREHNYLRGLDVVVVEVLKDALREEDYRSLTTDEAVMAAGGVGPYDCIEVAPILPETGRMSFVTSDPRAVDLEAFDHVGRGRALR